MRTATTQRADMRAAGTIEPTCEAIQNLVEQTTASGDPSVAHEMREFLQALIYDLEREADDDEADDLERDLDELEPDDLEREADDDEADGLERDLDGGVTVPSPRRSHEPAADESQPL